jgi:hypothetical protein
MIYQMLGHGYIAEKSKMFRVHAKPVTSGVDLRLDHLGDFLESPEKTGLVFIWSPYGDHRFEVSSTLHQKLLLYDFVYAAKIVLNKTENPSSPYPRALY